MSVGLLNKIVVFKKNTPAVKGAGFADAYTTLLTTRGQLRKKTGGRSLAYAEVNNNSGWELTVRYEPLLAENLSTLLKVEIDSVTYQVEDWFKEDDRNRYYKITINEQRN